MTSTLDPMTEPSSTTIYTIGHSNHNIEEFLGLLQLHDIQTLADVRSSPRSRYHHFNQAVLRNLLWTAGLEYVYLGEELGGHPESDEFYDISGHVVYERIFSTRQFRRAIQRTIDLSATTRLVLMCAEGDPSQCHRHPLIARVLLEHKICVQHIRRDGTLLEAAAMRSQHRGSQLPLLEPTGEDLSWRSPKRIR